jgi:hypothetical protein
MVSINIQTQEKAKVQGNLYDQDFYLWLEQTVKTLREKQFTNLDLDNLIEEIEAMGRSEKREIKNRLEVIFEHLLKLKYWLSEKEQNARGWRGTVVEQRRQLKAALAESPSPSLKTLLITEFDGYYNRSRQYLLRLNQLEPTLFPEVNPFTIEQILDDDYFPQ